MENGSRVMSNGWKVEVLDCYKDFAPPKWISRSLSRLINGIPQQYINGLHSIKLTNASGLNHSLRRKKTISQKKKVSVKDCRGLYHQKWHDNPATIELFVDNIISQWPKIILTVPLFQDILLADVLYHEVGHHIHKTSAPEHREREEVAEDWKKKLERQYFRQSYNWLIPIVVALRPLTDMLLRMARLRQKSAK